MLNITTVDRPSNDNDVIFDAMRATVKTGKAIKVEVSWDNGQTAAHNLQRLRSAMASRAKREGYVSHMQISKDKTYVTAWMDKAES